MDLCLHDIAAGRSAAREPHIAAYGRAAADSDAPQDRGSRVYDNVVFYDRMPCVAFNQRSIFIYWKTLGTQRYRLIKTYTLANDGGFSDDYPGAVVYEKTLVDLRSRVDINASHGMRYFCNHAGYERHSQFIKLMRKPVVRDSSDTWIAYQHFVDTACRRIPFIGSSDIAFQQTAYMRQLFCKCVNDRGSLPPIFIT